MVNEENRAMAILGLITPFNSLSAKRQKTNFTSAKFRKRFFQAILYLEFRSYKTNSIDLDEVAHNEPLYQDLRYLQILLVSSLVLLVYL